MRRTNGRLVPGYRALFLAAALGASLAAPALATAQESGSVGVSVAPWIRLYDEVDVWDTCCTGLGVWLQVGRFQVEHALATNTWWVAEYADDPEYPEVLRRQGQATTVLFDARTWRTARTVTRLRFGVGHRVAIARNRPRHSSALHVGVTIDLPAGGRSFLRAGMRGLFPEPHVGAGFRF